MIEEQMSIIKKTEEFGSWIQSVNNGVPWKVTADSNFFA